MNTEYIDSTSTASRLIFATINKDPTKEPKDLTPLINIFTEISTQDGKTAFFPDQKLSSLSEIRKVKAKGNCLVEVGLKEIKGISTFVAIYYHMEGRVTEKMVEFQLLSFLDGSISFDPTTTNVDIDLTDEGTLLAVAFSSSNIALDGTVAVFNGFQNGNPSVGKFIIPDKPTGLSFCKRRRDWSESNNTLFVTTKGAVYQCNNPDSSKPTFITRDERYGCEANCGSLHSNFFMKENGKTVACDEFVTATDTVSLLVFFFSLSLSPSHIYISFFHLFLYTQIEFIDFVFYF